MRIATSRAGRFIAKPAERFFGDQHAVVFQGIGRFSICPIGLTPIGK
jgi:hypothetical protein